MIGPKVRVSRWLLLCALAFGVIGMHHLGMASHDEQHGPASETPAGVVVEVVVDAGCCAVGTGHSGHGVPGRGIEWLLHLCLAVLAGVAVFIALLVRWRRLRRELRVSARQPGIPGLWPPRAPPDTATVLASLGVLRL